VTNLNASYLKQHPKLAQSFLASLSDEACAQLQYDWRFWARDSQIPPPGDWTVWLILAGRGFGKTRTGAQWVLHKIKRGCSRIALVGPTSGDARDVLVEGESGILACSPPWDRPVYEPSKRRLTWANGAIATTYSADEPERLRGPQHDAALCDELCSWRYAEAWDMLMFGLRLGAWPQACVATTPKPIKVLRDIMAAPDTVVTRGNTSDNVDNLAPSFVTRIVGRYQGTRLGRQELDAEILDDVPGALWTYDELDALRVSVDQLPGVLPRDDYRAKEIGEYAHLVERVARCMRRIVVSVDPSGTKGKPQDTRSTRAAATRTSLQEQKSNDVGIVVQGVGIDGHGYVLEDLTCNLSPLVWGQRVVDAYDRWQADCVIAEVNYGGALVESNLRAVNPKVKYKEVRASRGKAVRAEPIAGLYEQKKCHHLGLLSGLELQMTMTTPEGYTGDGSPDRMDAMVWGFTELMGMSDRQMPGPAVVTRATYHRTRGASGPTLRMRLQ
jgi:phage terminase large subunit-like protein